MNQKLEDILNLALETGEETRVRSGNLNVGFNEESQTWDLIVRYTGNLEEVGERIGVTVIPLIAGFGIAEVPQDRINLFSEQPEIIYIEKPKRLFFAVSRGIRASCITQVRSNYFPALLGQGGLYGTGVLLAVIDSGIDYRHPWFRTPMGESRIVWLWDQTIEGNPPAGFASGSEYGREEITRAIQAENSFAAAEIVPSTDTSRHGTAVAGIAAQAAPESELIIVKLGRPRDDGFPRTGELMQAVTYVLRKAAGMEMPVAINLSFGNNYGSHDGTSILETFMNEAAQISRNVIVAGTGNEGASGGHVRLQLTQNEVYDTELAVGTAEPTFNIQIWKSYADEFRIEVISPVGSVIPVLSGPGVTTRNRFAGTETELLAYFGEPRPYAAVQEIYLDFLPVGTYVDSGLWIIRIIPEHIVWGEVNLWLPGQSSLNAQTRFLRSTPDTTLTIPSTAGNVIAVGAYDSAIMAYADFSGRGNNRFLDRRKPDLVAPGVDIETAAPGGGTQIASGTSMAAPFVTAASALLMEWGVIRGNDRFLYGEKVKAYLQRGARPLPGFTSYPNPQTGWGALCVADSLPD